MENSSTTEDIEALVTKWYFQRKQKVPDADKEWLRAYREQEAVVEKDLWKEPMPDVPESERIELGPKENLLLQTNRGSQHAYGTKEFWKDWWARKKEKERVAAERVAAGVVGDSKGSATNPEPEKKKGKLLQNRKNQQQGKKVAAVTTPPIDPGVEAITASLSTLTVVALAEPPKKVKLVRKKVVEEMEM